MRRRQSCEIEKPRYGLYARLLVFLAMRRASVPVEYGVLAMLIGVAAIGAFSMVGAALQNMFDVTIGQAIANAAP